MLTSRCIRKRQVFFQPYQGMQGPLTLNTVNNMRKKKEKRRKRSPRQLTHRRVSFSQFMIIAFVIGHNYRYGHHFDKKKKIKKMITNGEDDHTTVVFLKLSTTREVIARTSNSLFATGTICCQYC